VLSDIYVMACVPNWQNGVPQNQGNPDISNQPFSGMNVVGNKFVQDQGEAAVGVYGVAGLNVESNNVEYEGNPSENFFLSNSVGIEVKGNMCTEKGRSSKSCIVVMPNGNK